MFESLPFCTLHIKFDESIHLLCSSAEVVFMQPLKKLFNLHNQKARNHSQQNPAKATAQCLALAVLTEEVSEYSDWLNWWRIVLFIRLLCKVPDRTRFQASIVSKRELRSSWLSRSVYCFGTTHQGSRIRFLTNEDGTDRLSRNVGKELPLLDYWIIDPWRWGRYVVPKRR